MTDKEELIRVCDTFADYCNSNEICITCMLYDICTDNDLHHTFKKYANYLKETPDDYFTMRKDAPLIKWGQLRKSLMIGEDSLT